MYHPRIVEIPIVCVTVLNKVIKTVTMNCKPRGILFTRFTIPYGFMDMAVMSSNNPSLLSRAPQISHGMRVCSCGREKCTWIGSSPTRAQKLTEPQLIFVFFVCTVRGRN